MHLIDTHTHIYLPAFDTDRSAMLQRARAFGVEKFFLPAIDSEVIDRMFALENDYPDECYAMMGVHPCSINEKWKEELNIAESWLQKRPFAAVGEIGLDYYWDTSFSKQQIDAFRIQIEWALSLNLPIVIHTRNAMQDTINIIKEYKGRGLRGIFHCFGGSFESAKQIIDAGFLLGIGGVVTYKKAGLRETLQHIPIERLVLETDAPYLTPEPFRGKRNECSYLQFVVHKLEDIYGISAEEVGEITTKTASDLFEHTFGLKGK
jgi:TatD DNase family protein